MSENSDSVKSRSSSMLTDLSLSLFRYGVAGRGDSKGGILGICMGVVGILLGVPKVDDGLTNSSSSSRTGVLAIASSCTCGVFGAAGDGAGEISRSRRGVMGAGDIKCGRGVGGKGDINCGKGEPKSISLDGHSERGVLGGV